MEVSKEESILIPMRIVLLADAQGLINRSDINKYHSVSDHDFWFTKIRVHLEVKRRVKNRASLIHLSKLLDKYFAARGKGWKCGLRP